MRALIIYKFDLKCLLQYKSNLRSTEKDNRKGTNKQRKMVSISCTAAVMFNLNLNLEHEDKAVSNQDDDQAISQDDQMRRRQEIEDQEYARKVQVRKIEKININLLHTQVET